MGMANAATRKGRVRLLGSTILLALGLAALGGCGDSLDSRQDCGAGASTLTGSLAGSRESHTATVLQDGKVLVAGGVSGQPGMQHPPVIAPLELYDPLLGTFAESGTLAEAREEHTATLLPSGQVLIAGGTQCAGVPYCSDRFGSAELYDPATQACSATGPMLMGRKRHTATLLQSGEVLMVGGDVDCSAELYDPATGTFSATGSSATTGYGAATLLPSGKVLVFDGISAELYDPATGTFSATGSPVIARDPNSVATGTVTLLPSGKVLAVGHSGDASAELYDPTTETWTLTGSMAVARYGNTVTLLPSGNVLVAGGRGGDPLASAELYDPGAGTFSVTGCLATKRQFHTATPLPSGNVLVVGGCNDDGGLASAELYDPE